MNGLAVWAGCLLWLKCSLASWMDMYSFGEDELNPSEEDNENYFVDFLEYIKNDIILPWYPVDLLLTNTCEPVRLNDSEQSSDHVDINGDSCEYFKNILSDTKLMPWSVVDPFDMIKFPTNPNFNEIFFSSEPVLDVSGNENDKMRDVYDLCHILYPNIIVDSPILSFGDTMGLSLFYLYTHKEVLEASVFGKFLNHLKCNDVIPLPLINLMREESVASNQIVLLSELFQLAIENNLILTAEVFFASGVANLTNPQVLEFFISEVTATESHNHQNHKCKLLIECFLKFVDKNVKLGEEFGGSLVHWIYSLNDECLFDVLLSYSRSSEPWSVNAIDWDVTNKDGFTVLGLMINSNTSFDPRYLKFLESTSHSNCCFHQNDENRNIVEECVFLITTSNTNNNAYNNINHPFPFQIKSKLNTFLDKRKVSDDFSKLLLTAAGCDSEQIFKIILSYRSRGHFFELDLAIKLIVERLSEDHARLASKYLNIIITEVENIYGKNSAHYKFFEEWKEALSALDHA